jgi:hypothetical protein
MLKGIDVNEVFEYVSPQDKEEPKTIFVVGNILHEDKIRIFSSSLKPDGTIDLSQSPKKAFDVLLAGLKGIKNLNGKDYTTITKEILNTLPFEILTELITKIIEFNQLGEVERKN